MVVGCRGAVNINPRHLMLPEASIKGVALGTSSPDQYKEMGSAIVAGIEAGWIKPVINREYGMSEVQQERNQERAEAVDKYVMEKKVLTNKCLISTYSRGPNLWCSFCGSITFPCFFRFLIKAMKIRKTDKNN
jgi:hypothetical protein